MSQYRARKPALVLAASAAILSLYFMERREEKIALPAAAAPRIRQVPLRLRSQRSLGNDTLPAQRLDYVLERLRPEHFTRTWTELLHGLRLWGWDGRWAAEGQPAQALLAYVLDGDRAASKFGVPFHLATRHGLEFVGWDTRSGSGERHLNQTLAVLGELGIRSGRAIRVDKNQYQVADLLDACVANFTWDQELEWTTVALALYMPPERRWINKFGQETDFDQLAQKLCARPLGEGTCLGMHTLYALTVLVSADSSIPVLTPDTRCRVLERLSEAVDVLERNQLADGGWPACWSPDTQLRPASSGQAEGRSLGIVVSGHALEWLALRPEQLRIPSQVAAKGCGYLLQRLAEVSDGELREDYCAYTHAGNALRLWLSPER